MTAQPDLFGQAPAQRHSPTSVAAAQAIEPRLGKLQAFVLEMIDRHGPITDNEIVAVTGLSPSTARPRRIELLRLGKIRQQGTRPTASGRQAAAWVAV